MAVSPPPVGRKAKRGSAGLNQRRRCSGPRQPNVSPQPANAIFLPVQNELEPATGRLLRTFILPHREADLLAGGDEAGHAGRVEGQELDVVLGAEVFSTSWPVRRGGTGGQADDRLGMAAPQRVCAYTLLQSAASGMSRGPVELYERGSRREDGRPR